ncbi:MAG: SBBP repeat-containing protein, partial [Promethearchaeota archaeon]
MKRGFIFASLVFLIIVLLGISFSSASCFAEEMNRHIASCAESPEAELIGQMQNTQFIENLGQFGNTEVAFYGHLGSSRIGFCADSVRFWTGSLGESIILSFEGAKRTEPRGATPQSSSNNYFLGERGTYANASGFKSIVYEGLWPGIDLIFTATKGGIKYEFHLSAHADPNQIKMRYKGHQTLNVKSTSLAAHNGEWIVNDEGLMAIQSGKEIQAAFVRCSEDTVGVRIDAYDRSRALTIDPLIYCTYLGGSGPERANDVFVDNTGQIYITGRTRSTDFPTISAFDETYSSGEDCYVLKLGSDGQSIIYSTYIGGTGDDVGYSITCDDSGNAYVTGYTRSGDFPTVNAYDDTFGGDRDCFVFKLNSTGTGLDFSTYLGDVNREIGWCVDLDDSGNVYVSGDTASINFPTVNAYDDSYNFGGDCFVTKFDSTGSSIIFSTFIGGSVLDYGYSMVVNGSGHVYLSGSTNSANFPMVNAYDSTHNGADDCFILLLNASGDALIFSTYIGGGAFDYAYDLAVDALGYSYIAGASLSDDYPVVNAYESQFGGDTDCIVSKLSRDGSSLVFSTYLGGTNRDEAQDIAVDSFGCVYITGFTGSSDFPIEAAFD